jgi:hypothetical protein
MTASNHAITGALVAVIVPMPALAIVTAFTAHFIMDGLPHFGINQVNTLKRNKDKRFLYVLIYDVAVSAILLLLVPVLLKDVVPIWLSAICMVVCMSPDLVWGWRFYHEVKDNTERPKSLFSRLHSWVQWSESPKGALVEVVWAILVISLIIRVS